MSGAAPEKDLREPVSTWRMMGVFGLVSAAVVTITALWLGAESMIHRISDLEAHHRELSALVATTIEHDEVRFQAHGEALALAVTANQVEPLVIPERFLAGLQETIDRAKAR